MQCKKASDNKYNNCPPLMADGRMFTDYRPRCIANFAVAGGASLPGNFDLPNSYEYRQYLIKNASDIMAKNRQMAYQNNACGPCTNPYNEGTMLPEQSMVKCDANKCSFYSNDSTGLGQGRAYNTTNDHNALRDRFIKKKEAEQEALAANVNQCWTPQDKQNIFSYNYDPSGNNERVAVPSGALPPSVCAPWN